MDVGRSTLTRFSQSLMKTDSTPYSMTTALRSPFRMTSTDTTEYSIPELASYTDAGTCNSVFVVLVNETCPSPTTSYLLPSISK